MSWWQAFILGIVEGLTEYLPVSSTGHLILVQWLIGLGENQAVNEFNVVIQAGAIVAVAGLYWPRLLQMGKGAIGRDPAGQRLLSNLALAFLPLAVVALPLEDLIYENLFAPWPVIAGLAAGGVLMIGVAWRRVADRREGAGVGLDEVTWRMALIVGVAQCVALWPGTSRSMMTIVAALLVGMRARSAAEFSFLLGLIVLAAATGYELLDGGGAMVEELGIAAIVIGFVASAVSAAVAVKWFVGFLNRRGLAPFGWYRVGLAVILAGIILSGVPIFQPAEETPASETEPVAVGGPSAGSEGPSSGE